MSANRDFWKNKKVLVTGHTGFVGAWMCAVLKYMEVDVYGISLEADKESLYASIKNSLDVKEYIQDIRDFNRVSEIIELIKPEIVIHLAAFGFVKECYEDVRKAYTTNVIGTMNVLEAIRNCNSVSNVLIVSSDKVYLNKQNMNNYLFKEDEKLGGIDPYSCSKTCEDLIAQSYFDTYLKELGIKLNIVRPGNILGGGDHIKTRLLPSMLEKFSNDELVDIRHPNAVRPWQHILDAIDAYLYVVQKTSTVNHMNLEIYNVGPDIEGQMSVGEIASYISSKFINPKVQFGNELSGVKEAAYLGVDITKLKEKINWQPKKKITEILDDTYNFWEKSQEQDKYKLCREQIEAYYVK